MRIQDVEALSTLTVEAVKDTGRIQYTVTVIRGLEQGLLVTHISDLKKLVEGVTFNAFMVDKEATTIKGWCNITIQEMMYHGKPHHLLIASGDVCPLNRRRGYRVFLGIRGKANLGHNLDECAVVIRDISEVGVAFIAKDLKSVILGSLVRLKFSDAGHGVDIAIQAVVVRKEPRENKECLYGCKLVGTHPNLYKYIINKQREYLRKKRLDD